MKSLLRASGLAALLLTGCAASTTERLHLPPLTTVPAVDLARYVGTWYEIASFPQSFQKGCTATTATYTARPDGQIDVLNRCRKGSLDGEETTAEGRARVVDQTTHARLEVSFFRPFWGDYWIIQLAPDYRYAVVGHPGRDYLWILSRSPQLDAGTYDAILTRLKEQGYEVARLQKTLQPEKTGPAGPAAPGR
jgi:apolipoprotein D and lipocalin family protein